MVESENVVDLDLREGDEALEEGVVHEVEEATAEGKFNDDVPDDFLQEVNKEIDQRGHILASEGERSPSVSCFNNVLLILGHLDDPKTPPQSIRTLPSTPISQHTLSVPQAPRKPKESIDISIVELETIQRVLIQQFEAVKSEDGNPSWKNVVHIVDDDDWEVVVDADPTPDTREGSDKETTVGGDLRPNAPSSRRNSEHESLDYANTKEVKTRPSATPTFSSVSVTSTAAEPASPSSTLHQQSSDDENLANPMTTPEYIPASMDSKTTALSTDAKTTTHPSAARLLKQLPDVNTPPWTSVGKDLVTTPTLSKFGLVFNKSLRLIICSTCCEGLPLCSVRSHLRAESASRATYQHGAWHLANVEFRHPGQACIPPPKLFKERLISSLIEANIITDADEILDSDKGTGWIIRAMASLSPSETEEELDAIAGLRKYDHSLGCNFPECDYTCRTLNTIQSHWSKTASHKGYAKLQGRSRYRHVTTQTLCEFPGYEKFFRVREPDKKKKSVQPSSGSPEVNFKSEGEFLKMMANMMHEQKNDVMEELNLSPIADQKTILPFIRDSRIEGFTKKHERTVPQLRPPPIQAIDTKYRTLRQLALRLALDKLALFRLPEEPINPTVLAHITNAGRCSDVFRRPFTELTLPASISAYVLLEVKFVWALLQARRKPKTSPFRLTQQQNKDLDTLENLLEEGAFSSSAQKVFNSLLYSIYFPDEASEHVLDIFYSPIIAFAALQFRESNGNYINPFHIPPILAKIQYMMRLSSLPHLHSLRKDRSAKEYNT